MPCQQSVILKDLLYGVSYKCHGHKAILIALKCKKILKLIAEVTKKKKKEKKKSSDLKLGLHSQEK